MEFIFNRIFLEHETGMHPENRKRFDSIKNLKETKVENGKKWLSLFHKDSYVRQVREICKSGGGHLDIDTSVSKKSYKAALYAVGATVMASNTGNLALVRPPGHHAHPDRSSGFCLFNNISIAVQRLLRKGMRVFVFDFDSHLGDGTSSFFYNDKRVLYLSLHQYPAFPGRGWIDEIGEGEGRGYNINIPLARRTGDDIYMRAVERFIPIAKQFRPDVVAISAGFDGHHSEILLDLKLSMNTYYKLGEMLGKNFDNVFATLEGGYNVDVFPKCLENFLDGINGKRMRNKENPTDSSIFKKEEFESRIKKLEKKLSEYWDI